MIMVFQLAKHTQEGQGKDKEQGKNKGQGQ